MSYWLKILKAFRLPIRRTSSAECKIVQIWRLSTAELRKKIERRKMAKKAEIVKPAVITSSTIQMLSVQQRIFIIRGKQVMVDRDLATLYGVETRVLKQAVNRNPERFPEEFMFQLDNQEFEKWRSQIVMSKVKREQDSVRSVHNLESLRVRRELKKDQGREKIIERI